MPFTGFFFSEKSSVKTIAYRPKNLCFKNALLFVLIEVLSLCLTHAIKPLCKRWNKLSKIFNIYRSIPALLAMHFPINLENSKFNLFSLARTLVVSHGDTNVRKYIPYICIYIYIYIHIYIYIYIYYIYIYNIYICILLNVRKGIKLIKTQNLSDLVSAVSSFYEK